jgi:hypothetical protein
MHQSLKPNQDLLVNCGRKQIHQTDPRPRELTSTFRRINSEPETPPGPLPGGRQAAAAVAPKCTKEEIECKRQEALRRRLANSQRK